MFYKKRAKITHKTKYEEIMENDLKNLKAKELREIAYKHNEQL